MTPWIGIPIQYAKTVFGIAVIATIYLGIQASQLSPDDRLVDRIPHQSEAWSAFEHCDQAFGGVVFLEYMIEWPEDATLAQVNQVIAEVDALIEDEPLVSSPITVVDWLSLIPAPFRKHGERRGSGQLDDGEPAAATNSISMLE